MPQLVYAATRSTISGNQVKRRQLAHGKLHLPDHGVTEEPDDGNFAIGEIAFTMYSIAEAYAHADLRCRHLPRMLL